MGFADACCEVALLVAVGQRSRVLNLKDVLPVEDAQEVHLVQVGTAPVVVVAVGTFDDDGQCFARVGFAIVGDVDGLHTIGNRQFAHS